MQDSSFCACSFHLTFHPCRSVWQDFFLFMAKWYAKHMPHFFIHLCVNKHLGCFHLLTIVNNATINRGGQIFLWDIDFNSLGMYSEMKWLDHRVVAFLILWEIARLFSTALSCTILHSHSAQGFNFSTCSPTLVIFCFMDNGYLNQFRLLQQKYHRPGSLNNKHLFFTVLEA